MGDTKYMIERELDKGEIEMIKNKMEDVAIFGDKESLDKLQDVQALSDEDVETIASTLEENMSEDVKHLREINNTPYPNNTINKPELFEGEALVEINPITGEQTIIGTAVDKQPRVEVSMSDMIDGNDEEALETVIKEDTYSKLNEYGLTTEEAEEFTKVIMRKMSGEKFSIYKELPTTIKNMVRSMCGSNNINQLQACSEIVVDQFISELKIEQEFIDFQDTLKKEMNIPDLTEMYDEYLKETMEEKLLQKAEELEESQPEKAQTLREISAAYSDSYTFARQLKAYHNNDKAIRRLDKEVKKYDRYCTEFNYKYKDSKFKINDVSLVAHSLDRLFKDEFKTSTIKKFVVLFCRICINMTPNNIVEHSFMYYTIKNILALDFMKIDSQVYIDMYYNIKSVLELIEVKETEENDRIK